MTSASFTPPDREIVFTRLLDAPRERVWRAWTEISHLEQWWGPNGFTVTTHEFNLREGGLWRFIMHGPDGHDYPNHIVFTKIVAPELLEHDHGADDGQVHFHVTVTFEQENGKTRLTMRSVFPTAEERDRVIRENGAIEGGNQTLDRLRAYLVEM